VETIVAIVGLWVIVVAGVVIPAYINYEAPPEILFTDTESIELTEFSFSQTDITVAPGTDLTFELLNVGGSQHNFGFSDDNVTERIKPGNTDSFHAGVLTKDRTFFCGIPGHRDNGMELTVHVSGS